MCGIAGVLSISGRPIDLGSVKTMVNALEHRGPDGIGLWSSKDQKLGLGHQRLSIIDLSDKGSQPMQDRTLRYTIIYNGEIYNYLELRGLLLSKNYEFKSDSDTEVILGMYSEFGEKCLNYLDGMFAFAIWDEQAQELFCARDRFGEKPFFYSLQDGMFIFASEIKALKAYGLRLEADPEKIYQYLLFGTIYDVNEPAKTFYSNIFSLEQAHSLSIDGKGSLKKAKYWGLENAKTDSLSDEDSIDKFKELIQLSVKRRMRSDVEVGASLSGGLDSSTLAALMLNQSEKKINVFSARFENFEKDEGQHIKKMCDTFPNLISHEVFCTQESFENSFEEVSQTQDEPFGSLSIVAQYEVMKLAKEKGIKVIIDGQGADEFLAGYPMFYSTYYNQLYQTNRKIYNKEVNAYKELKSTEWKQNKASAIAKLKFKHEKAFQKIASIRRKSISSNSDYFMGIHPDLITQYKGGANPISKPYDLKSHLSISVSEKGLQELLRYSDRNAMAHSVEVRLPFLSHELVEFVFGLKDDLLIRNAWTKYILRKSMSDILPKEICWRKDKVGFEPPQASVMSSEKFTERVKAAEARLKQNGIIKQPRKELAWNYLMLDNYIS